MLGSFPATNDLLYKKITAGMCLDHPTGFANWRWDEPDQKLRVNSSKTFIPLGMKMSSYTWHPKLKTINAE